ncbi:MAG: glycosyltransferase family 39 protein [Candidatus Levybacteria bacterium]|nr:glycosyltransferase family 39 protein [Candidatus Levybacteria bacterium]
MENNKPLLVIFIFFIAIISHLIGINKIGRTWDEQFKVDMGYIAWDRIFAGDFSTDSWKIGEEHPMVAKYVYGLFIRPEMIRLDDGRGNLRSFLLPNEITQISNGNYIITQLNEKLFAVNYDFTFPRIASALFNSIAIAVVTILAFFMLKGYWVLVPGLFLVLTPRFLVMGQLITYESLSVFLFSLTAFFFYHLLKNPKITKLYVIIGFLCGLLFWTRYNNIYVFLFLTGWLLIHYLFNKKMEVFNWRLILIPLISFFLGIAIWPLMWSEFPKYLLLTFQENQVRPIGPSFYFVGRLLVTTPVPIILGLIIGIFVGFTKRNYFLILLLWWFFSALMFFSLVSIQMGGTRYIFVIYPAIAILSAFGFSKILKGKFAFLLVILVIFMIWDMARAYPYYLDYYNQIIGGSKEASGKDYEFSWWGEGQREIGFWINKNLPQGSSVALIVTPKYVFPSLRKDLINKGYSDEKTDADYVVVTRGDSKNLPLEFFMRYKNIYNSEIEGEYLVSLYKRNTK